MSFNGCGINGFSLVSFFFDRSIQYSFFFIYINIYFVLVLYISI